MTSTSPVAVASSGKMIASPIAAAERSPADRARFVREQLPSQGLFAGHDWRVSPDPFRLGAKIASELESLGRVLLQFYRAVNLLYRKSIEGRQLPWVAQWLDLGKPASLIEIQRSPSHKNEIPRVIRPDLLISEQGLSVTELDSVPGGIGLTAWLNDTYSRLGAAVVGGADGMLQAFASIFGDAARVHIVVSEEAATYRPEMEWVADRLGTSRFNVQRDEFAGFEQDDAVYRFFELFDLPNVPSSAKILDLAASKVIR